MTEDQGARPRGPRLRGVLDDIPVYKPGRPAVSAAGAPAYKLSSNENPYPPLPGVLEAAVAAAGALNRYPDLGCAALTAELAKRFDVPEAHIATGTGSVGVAQQLVQSTAGPGDEGKPSRTRFRVLERFAAFTWVELEPETGRQHQIRVHLTALGHPLAVDETYRGAERRTAAELGGQGDEVVLARTPLHCARMVLPVAPGRAITVEAPLPADLERALGLLRGA